MRNHRARFGLFAAAAASIAITSANDSHAWKPYTHVYLAQQAWSDAIDGKVTIYKIDGTGQVARDAQHQPIKIGEFRVQQRILTAIKNKPEKFFAGVLGPDAYPDIITGQERIHPPGPTSAQISADPRFKPDSNADGPGTDAWLQQLWAKAWADGSDDAIAWTVGFLSHAAGDVYAHTFMNTFAGGIFDIYDMQGLNWFKHITVEGYVGERTPELSLISIPNNSQASVFDIVRDNGITGIEPFIANNTWDVWVPGTSSGTAFPDEANKQLSVPYLLQQVAGAAGSFHEAVATYDSYLLSSASDYANMASPSGLAAELDWACGGSTCPDPNFSASSCPGYYPHGDSWASGTCAGMAFGGLAVWGGAWASLALMYLTMYLTEHPIAVALEGWATNAKNTVPLAQRDWVTASHNTAIHLFFTSDHLMHTDGDEFPDGATLGDGYKTFKIDLESIASGLNPSTVAAINQFITFVKSPVTLLNQVVGDAEKWVVDQVFQATLHMTTDQAKQCFMKPHMWFNPLLKSNATGTPASILSANAIMRIPATSPATCVGSSTQKCTLSPSLVGTDVQGACDILGTGAPAKFSVHPEDAQGVFPAAFNTVNMIKLLLMEPADVASLANGQKSSTSPSLSLEIPPGAPSAPPNAMLNFAATIDGSHEWLARRSDAGWGGSRMILARDCQAYRSVFLDQRPDFNSNVQPVNPGAEPKLLPGSSLPTAWEPDAVNCAAPPMINVPQFGGSVHVPANGPITVTATEGSTFTLASSSKNANALPFTRGSLVVASDSKSATYVPPKWATQSQDQVVVTSKDGTKRTVLNIPLPSQIRGGLTRDVPKTPVPGKGDPAALQSGEVAQLVGSGKPMTWTIVSGSGSVGDPKLEATHQATLTTQLAVVADKEKALVAQRLTLHNAKCIGPCRTTAGTQVVTAARARIQAKLDASATQKKLDDVRATYHAPASIAKDEIVTLRGVDKDGAATTVKLRLRAAPAALKLKVAPTTVNAGKDVKLEIDHGLLNVKGTTPNVPMTWAIVSGPGSIGDPATRAKHAAQKQAFLAGLDAYNQKLVNASPWDVEAARTAWLSYVQGNVAKYASSFAALDDIDRTYHAPPKIAGKQRVTLRGTAQDGSGRTLDVSFDLMP